jgi:mono/diheme cytochrome c family protein
MRTIAAMVVVLGICTLGATAQGPVPREPMLQKTTVGAELYRFYCSNCHGLDARGRPASPAMRTAAPDLTSMSLNNGGVFPRERVRDIITNGTGSHRSNDMPVWGAIFRALDPNDTMTDVRIDNLVRYLESMQTGAVGTRLSH